LKKKLGNSIKNRGYKNTGICRDKRRGRKGNKKQTNKQRRKKMKKRQNK